MSLLLIAYICCVSHNIMFYSTWHKWVITLREISMALYLYCDIMVYEMTDVLVCLATFTPLIEVTGCPVYDDRYAIHTYDGLWGFDSFSSTWKPMIDGDTQIIQYVYIIYVCLSRRYSNTSYAETWEIFHKLGFIYLKIKISRIL
jgi:hypothetical protein